MRYFAARKPAQRIASSVRLAAMRPTIKLDAEEIDALLAQYVREKPLAPTERNIEVAKVWAERMNEHPECNS
jgi:hypothetical protein